MLFPKSRKFKKARKLVSKGVESKVVKLKFGFFGLKATGNGRLTAKHIETARQTINRKIRPFGKLWIRVFPDIPVTSIPSKIRMGKGKGSIDYWGCAVRKGQVLYEVSGISRQKALTALNLGGRKLPFKTKFIEY